MPKLLDENSLLAIKTYIDAIALTLAPAFSDSTTYDAGDVVSHQNKLYKCKNDDTEGTWDSSEWDEVDVLTLINASKSIKTLDTFNSNAQTVYSNESLIGTGSVKLHKVSKTGLYSDLNMRPIFNKFDSTSYSVEKSITALVLADISVNFYISQSFRDACYIAAIVFEGQDQNGSDLTVTLPVYGPALYSYSSDEVWINLTDLYVLNIIGNGNFVKISNQDGFDSVKLFLSNTGMLTLNEFHVVAVNY